MDTTPGNSGDARDIYQARWQNCFVRVCCGGHLLTCLCAAAAQDDVDVYRSFANMLPGGFSVGSTTGWLNNTEPEFLRRVAAALAASCWQS